MADERDTRAEQQGDGQPENQRELDDPSSGAALSGRPRTGDDAADHGATAAAFRRGLSDDLARRAARNSELEQDL
jgi:hypothetical protein